MYNEYNAQKVCLSNPVFKRYNKSVLLDGLYVAVRMPGYKRNLGHWIFP